MFKAPRWYQGALKKGLRVLLASVTIGSRYVMHNTSSMGTCASVNAQQTEVTCPSSFPSIDDRSSKTVYRAPDGSIPPCSNTGGDSTKMLFDWLSITFIEKQVNEVLELMTPSIAGLAEWVALPKGMMGYKGCFQRGQIRVLHDGSPGMGVHIIMSGQAMRQWEAENFYTEESWCDFFRYVRALGGRFKRIDVAFDDTGTEAVLDMEVIGRSLRERNLVSPFKEADRRTSEKIPLHEDGGNRESETYYLGSRQSHMFVRIYNKAAQMGYPEGVHWVRVELQAKAANAEQLITMILQHGFSVVGAVLRHYVDFKEPPAGGDSNKSRWETAPWWDKFLNSCEKAPLNLAKSVTKTIEEVKKWVVKQAAPLLAVIADSIEKECRVSGLNYRRMVARYFVSLVEDGRGRYKAKHRQLLGSHVPRLAFGKVPSLDLC